MPRLSVIVPVYNERKTIKEILSRINSVDIDKEIVVVDDGSDDGTTAVLREINYNNLKVIYHTRNRGKGSAFLTGLANAVGRFVIIQDADLEYNPGDYIRLIREIEQGNADMILGMRFIDGHTGLLIHRLGNKFLTALLNFLFGGSLNDYATCYKLASRDTWNSLGLRATGFDIEVEIVCRILRSRKRLLELPISYYPRTYKEGKKIRWLDGLWAIFYMCKYRLLLRRINEKSC